MIKIKKVEKDKLYIYQRQQITKIERDFLLALESACGKPIPAVSQLEWDRYPLTFGFVAKDSHVVGLGLSSKASDLTIIPETIKNLTFLEILTLDGLHNLKYFPENIIYLKNLRRLRYGHSPAPHIKTVDRDSLPKSICELISIEELEILGSSISKLPECLVYFPNLKKIIISHCNRLQKITPLFEKYFSYHEYEYPLRRYLIRKKNPPDEPLKRPYPKLIYGDFIEGKLKEDELINLLIEIIREGKSLKSTIESIQILKKISIRNERIFHLLTNLVSNNKSTLIKINAAETLLNIFPEKSFAVIKRLFIKEKSVEVKRTVKRIISNINIPSIMSKLGELRDILTIVEIENINNYAIQEIDFIEPTTKGHHGRIAKYGYVKELDRIIKLTLTSYNLPVGHKLKKFPESLGTLDQLGELKLIDCREMTSLPQSIGNLQNLTSLDCSGCRELKSLPESIGDLKKLEHLDLTGCYSLEKIPSTLCDLENLKTLNLKDCQSIINLSESLDHLISLKLLNLENCRSLKSIPNSIIKLKNIEDINMSRCRRLEKLPEKIGDINSLKNLKLDRCTILNEIPESIGNLRNQKIIDLSYCYFLKKLPEAIGNLKNLKKICLKGCRELQSLPEKIAYLENLEELDLYACRKLLSLPINVGNMINLRKLELSYCSCILVLPESILNLEKLEELNLNGCISLISIPNDIGLLINLKVFKSNDKRNYQYPSEAKTKTQQESPRYEDRHDRMLEIRKYQEKINSEIDFPKNLLKEKTQKLENIGVSHDDAHKLARFYRILDKIIFKKAELGKNLDEDFDDMLVLHHFKINSDGHVVELHLHYAEAISLTIFPKMICDLKFLEVIRFPNNVIRSIPECISNLKALRIFDVSNYSDRGNSDDYWPTPPIPKSIKSFVKTLEGYNEFYKF